MSDKWFWILTIGLTTLMLITALFCMVYENGMLEWYALKPIGVR